MALSFDSTLTNAKGVSKVILFKGLSHPMVLTPTILGEPVFTAQPFYFLNEMDCVMRIRFENPQREVPDLEATEEFNDFIENLIDNYLFEYSKKYPGSKVTSKITNYSYWKDDLDEAYFLCDRMNVQYLALDVLNDEAIISCKDSETGMEYNDWFLMKNYKEWSFEEYINCLRRLFSKTVDVEVEGHQALGTGKSTLPLVKTNPTILTFHQAQTFEVVSSRDFKEGKEFYPINRGMPSRDNFRVEQEVVEAEKYHDKELLAYFFSALRDKSPLTQFRNLYNVLEFFFEEAPQRVGVNAKIERDMIKAVFSWAINDTELQLFLYSLPSEVLTAITTEQTTTSGEIIQGIDLSSTTIGEEVSKRVYEIRNACMHSKKTRRGNPTARFVPTSKEESILRNEFWLMHWLAIKVIEKDTEERC
ncbi:hypothetical protein HLV40_16385 [Chromohalobacter salexigens]|nr:hypothetical protein [Chromohalobacter salexigens]